MKGFFLFLVLMMGVNTVFAQQRVIVMMVEKLDNSQLAKKTRNMTKAERRDFVIQ